MSIPIDKLYHYIENIAQDIRGDNVLIYRFYPHGSKNIDDLVAVTPPGDYYELYPMVCCNDQEPLDYDYYEQKVSTIRTIYQVVLQHEPSLISIFNSNLRKHSTIYDHVLLLHSEKRSKNLIKYQTNNFIPVYYWSHALIALDWFRFAQHDRLTKNVTTKFLIYNRAWSGTREYRIKFIDLLIDNNLVEHCQTSFNSVEPQLRIHYTDHSFVNFDFSPTYNLEKYVKPKEVDSSASADYEINDYNSTDFEVVLETLFDDDRLHLTEKILRPISLGQPFLLAATHGSLEYLRSYGFKTFSDIIDESYDSIENPLHRLQAIVKTMKQISLWTDNERAEKMLIANQIAAYNKMHFFSSNFNKQVVTELIDNLATGLDYLENNNTSERFFELRKLLSKNIHIRKTLLGYRSRKATAKIIYTARQYYLKHCVKSNS